MGIFDSRLEAVYLIDNNVHLHLLQKKNKKGYDFAAYDSYTKRKIVSGDILHLEILFYPNHKHNELLAARNIAIQKIGLSGEKIQSLAISTLETLPEACSDYKRRAPILFKEKYIPFTNRLNREMFRLPDESTLQVTFSDRINIFTCRSRGKDYMDIGPYYYTSVTEFVERMEKNGGICEPEPEIQKDEAAWQVGFLHYFYLRKNFDGWKYLVYNHKYRFIESGSLKHPGLTMLEAREFILSRLKLKMDMGVRYPVDVSALFESVRREKLKDIPDRRKAYT